MDALTFKDSPAGQVVSVGGGYAALIPCRPRLAGATSCECDVFLRRLAEGEPLLALKFNRRLQELAGPPARPQAAATRRTWAELRETAERLRQAEARRQQAEAEAKRVKDLQDFAPRAPQAWRDVQALIEEKKARPDDEAVALVGQAARPGGVSESAG